MHGTLQIDVACCTVSTSTSSDLDITVPAMALPSLLNKLDSPAHCCIIVPRQGSGRAKFTTSIVLLRAIREQNKLVQAPAGCEPGCAQPTSNERQLYAPGAGNSIVRLTVELVVLPRALPAPLLLFCNWSNRLLAEAEALQQRIASKVAAEAARTAPSRIIVDTTAWDYCEVAARLEKSPDCARAAPTLGAGKKVLRQLSPPAEVSASDLTGLSQCCIQCHSAQLDRSERQPSCRP